MSRLITTIILSAPPTAGALLYLYLRTSTTSTAQWALTASPQHRISFAQSVVNPRGYATEHDSLTLRLPPTKIPESIRGREEEILARFTRGFFCGLAFWLERKFFALSGFRNTWYSTPDLAKKEVWDPSEISGSRVPALGSLLFGNFLVLDSSSAEEEERIRMSPAAEKFARPSRGAFVEIAFGRDVGRFSGTHRFEVCTEEDSEEGDGADGAGRGVVVVRLSQVRGNPTQDGKFIYSWINWFHMAYARCLLASAVSEIMRSDTNR